ncbi:MAG: hypothetical protein FK733_06845 [Asgard group archaeon]|nr:hypothetical protein [Asgard group archaeon]
MAFAARSKFFWSRFIATCVKYLGVANTQQLRFIAEKLMPTEMSRQNILYHVRIAEEKGWIVTFASALELSNENEFMFRKRFLELINEKISAQRFVVIGTEYFDVVKEEEIIGVSKEFNLEPINIQQYEVLTIITDLVIKRLSSVKPKASGNQSLFMVLLRFGWYWLNINPEVTRNIIGVILQNTSKHNYNDHYKIDVDLLNIISSIELEILPEISFEDLMQFLEICLEYSKSQKRIDTMNLMSMTLLISGRYLVAYNKIALADEYINRGIKYLRLSKRKSILMRKLHVDGLFDLGFIYSQQGWFYKALDIYENIERIINEEFTKDEPIHNLLGRLELARAELSVMMAFPAYTFQDEDYRSSLVKAIKYAQKAMKHYQSIKNSLKETEITLLTAWIYALIGRMKRAEQLVKKGTKNLVAPVPPKLNMLFYNAQAEIYRKNGKYALAIKNISQSFDHLKILGQIIAKLFCMMRLAELHVQLSNSEDQFSFISFGNVSNLFSSKMSDMISHVFLENTRFLNSKSNNVISFYINNKLIENHPEIANYADFLPVKNISSVLLGESFTILPFDAISFQQNGKKAICIRSSTQDDDSGEEFILPNFSNILNELDNTFQKLLSES